MSHEPTDPASSAIDVDIGTVLAGKYRVDRVLGAGGMGVVVAATHMELEAPVALKFLLREVRNNQEVVARFAREARASAQIRSEYVARTLDVGRLENGSPYIVMEYLEGCDLARRIEEQGPLSIQAALRLILQACEALTEAHAIGIIHRDLKPSNLFITQRRDGNEVVKLLDFGISKIMASSGSNPSLSMTRTSSVMGSPLYMAPEQLISARNVDQRSDVWALGVTLYEALAGTPPFAGDSLPEVCARVMTQAPEPLRSKRADVPPLLDAAIMRCLQKDPAQRFATAAELAAALQPLILASSADRIQSLSQVSGSTTASTVELMPPTIAWRANPDGAHGVKTQPSNEQGQTVLASRTVGAWGHTKEELDIPKKSLRLPLFAVLGAGVVAAVVVAVWKWANPDGTDNGKNKTNTSASSASASPAPQGINDMAGAVRPDAGIAPVQLAEPQPINPASAQRLSSGKHEPAPATRTHANGNPNRPGAIQGRTSKDLFSDRN